MHTFKNCRQAGQVVVEDLGCAGHVFGHDQAQALCFFHQRRDAFTPLVKERNDGQAFLAEEFDRQCRLVGTIGHVGEFFSQIEQDGFGGADLSMCIGGRHTQGFQGSATFIAVDLGVEHSDRQFLQRLGQSFRSDIRQLGRIVECCERFDRDTGFL